ncbi:MAG: hypothetical protein JSR46_12385 [Verrucomicrobia bacterium]|nr:hypothetical protein [Verrucomicrobiota bacterium]
MKKLLLLSILSVSMGASLLAGGHAHKKKDVTHRVKHEVKGKAKAKAKAQVNAACSRSSSDRGCKVVCCEKERHPVYASAVANGSANMQIVATGAPIIFNSLLNISNSVYYNSSTGVFTVVEPGTYEIIYGARFTGTFCVVPGYSECDVFNTDPCASIALQINGTEVPGSQVNNASAFDEDEIGTSDWVTVALIQTVNSGTTIAVTAANADINGIQLINMDLGAEPCDNGDTTAFISIKKIS